MIREGQGLSAGARPFDCALGKRVLASGGLAGAFCWLTEGDAGACGGPPVADVRANTVFAVETGKKGSRKAVNAR